VSLDSTWISNLSSNKKIWIRRITADTNPNWSYPFKLNVNYYVLQDEIMNIDSTVININLTAQKMSDIGQIIVDWIKENVYGYLLIYSTMPTDTKLIFYLTNDGNWWFFNLPDDDTIKVTHDTISTHSFNNDN
jgi:hypothetical protein